MKLILHIGMGKTGTTSIQKALKSNTAALADQKVHYLGMWFGMIAPEYDEFQGANNFMRQDRTVQEDGARKLVQYLQEIATKEGTETFILSNEALFGHAEKLEPFISALAKSIELKLVVYMRDPHFWLPSAFTQWELHHKTHKGKVLPFPEQSRKLIKVYSAFSFWMNTFPDNVLFRKHDTKIDVVQDFGNCCGVELQDAETRALVRNEPAEVLLRAAFNNRIPNEVLPQRFEATVLNPRRGVESISAFADICFSYDGVPEIVEENRAIFDEIHQKLGAEFNFLTGSETDKVKPDEDELNKRLTDFLIEICFQQGERITRLERQLKEMQND